MMMMCVCVCVCVTMQDTVTGFLLAGIGEVNLRKQKNFMIVGKGVLVCVAHRCTARRALPQKVLMRCEWVCRDVAGRD